MKEREREKVHKLIRLMRRSVRSSAKWNETFSLERFSNMKKKRKVEFPKLSPPFNLAVRAGKSFWKWNFWDFFFNYKKFHLFSFNLWKRFWFSQFFKFLMNLKSWPALFTSYSLSFTDSNDDWLKLRRGWKFALNFSCIKAHFAAIREKIIPKNVIRLC